MVLNPHFQRLTRRMVQTLIASPSMRCTIRRLVGKSIGLILSDQRKGSVLRSVKGPWESTASLLRKVLISSWHRVTSVSVTAAPFLLVSTIPLPLTIFNPNIPVGRYSVLIQNHGPEQSG